MFTPVTWAEEKGGGDLRAAVQNPVGAMYSLPLKFNFDYGAPNGEASFLNIQPVIPITVGDWNYINRIIAPLIDTPGQVAGTPEIPNPPPGDGATGTPVKRAYYPRVSDFPSGTPRRGTGAENPYRRAGAYL